MVAQNYTPPTSQPDVATTSYQPDPPIQSTETQSSPKLIQVAYAPETTKGNWGVQVGAYSSAQLAQQATFKAKQKVSDLLASANQSIQTVNRNGSTLYRARLVGVNQIAAIQACRQLKEKGMSCVTVQ